MSALSYQEIRGQIRTGDLLVWKKDRLSFFSNLFMNLVRLGTRSEFAHLAIAVIYKKRLFVVEATMPYLRIYPVSNYDEFYHIAMEVDVSEEDEDWLYGKVGDDYSIAKAFKAYFNASLEDDGTWQCAELANRFYRRLGRDYGDIWTPSAIVNAILEEGRSIRLVKNH